MLPCQILYYHWIIDVKQRDWYWIHTKSCLNSDSYMLTEHNLSNLSYNLSSNDLAQQLTTIESIAPTSRFHPLFKYEFKILINYRKLVWNWTSKRSRNRERVVTNLECNAWRSRFSVLQPATELQKHSFCAPTYPSIPMGFPNVNTK